MKSALTTGIVALCLLLPGTATADSVSVGDVEFNRFAVGVNDFAVNNFTGSNNLGFFPVGNDVTFDNVVLIATESGGTIVTFHLGDIDPGTNTSAQVADTLLFTKVVFSATLSTNSLMLTNGSSGTLVPDPTLSFTLLPSGGTFLAAGVDLGTFNASPAVASANEPPSLWFLAVGLFAISGLLVRRSVKLKRISAATLLSK